LESTVNESDLKKYFTLRFKFETVLG